MQEIILLQDTLSDSKQGDTKNPFFFIFKSNKLFKKQPPTQPFRKSLQKLSFLAQKLYEFLSS